MVKTIMVNIKCLLKTTFLCKKYEILKPDVYIK